MSSVYTPTKSNLAHAAAQVFRAILLSAAASALETTFNDISSEAASLTTDLTGANNDLVFTAKSAGISGNKISVTYVDPGEETAEESVSVSGLDIVVTLRSVSDTLSTAAEVTAAIEGSDAADALVGVADAAANNGTGEVTAMEKAYLTGGVNAQSREEQIAEAMGVSVGTAERFLLGSELDLADTMLAYNALVAAATDDTDAGVVAFQDAVTAGLVTMAGLPEG